MSQQQRRMKVKMTIKIEANSIDSNNKKIQMKWTWETPPDNRWAGSPDLPIRTWKGRTVVSFMEEN